MIQFVFYSLINFQGISQTIIINNTTINYVPFYSDSTCISTYVKSTDIKQSALNFIPASIKVEGKSVNIFYTGSGNGIRNSCSAKFPIIPVANYNNITGKIGPVDYSWVIRYNLPTIDSYNNHLPGIGGAFVTMLI